MKQVARFLPVVMALMLVFTGIDKKGSFDIEKKGSFDIDKKGSFDILAGGTGKGGEDVPVTPGLVAGGYSVNTGGTSKGGDTPVVTG